MLHILFGLLDGLLDVLNGDLVLDLLVADILLLHSHDLANEHFLNLVESIPTNMQTAHEL